ncbi:MAG TPA: NAD(P)-dependent oxidoreductase [Anaerolineales bacterium]|nr:NAD(P)-dependent oxidoreductase [Anaerolineales bacterium]
MGLRILLSAPYLIPVYERFRSLFEDAGFEVIIPDVNERLSESQLLQYAGEIDGVICGDDQFTARVLQASAPRLKVISKWGTGVDSIERQTAATLGVQVCNTPGAFTEAVADTVLGYILCFARMLPWMDRSTKSGAWSKTPIRALHETTIGVIGIGKIGKAVLRRVRPFGARLLGNDIVEIDSTFLSTVAVEMMPLEDLLGQADFISINCDLNPTSEHLIRQDRLALMKPEAVLVNTARGPIIDEASLVEALRAGRIAGAALDVFEDEPLPADSQLRQMDNVLLGPHNANGSPSAWEKVHWNTIRNLFSGLGLPEPGIKAGK